MILQVQRGLVRHKNDFREVQDLLMFFHARLTAIQITVPLLTSLHCFFIIFINDFIFNYARTTHIDLKLQCLQFKSLSLFLKFLYSYILLI